MFQVRNREALRLLAGRQMKKNRRRNAVAIGAIILTSILFSTLFTIGGGALRQAQQGQMRTTGGTGHASVKYLSMPEYEKLKAAGGYEKIGYSILTGRCADERLKRINTEVRYAQDFAAKSFMSCPTEGTMPAEKTEIAISRIVLEALELPDELGSRITFPIDVDGTLHEDTFTLCGVWDGDPLCPAQMAWVSESYSEEIAPTLMAPYEDGAPYNGCVGAEINFSNTWNVRSKMEALLLRAGFPDDTPIGVNPVYDGFQIDPSLILEGGVLLTAILVSGYLIIYNVFYLSVTQDIQFYGLLKTIGASGKQLRKIVFRQAMQLACIGVPAGLLAGYALGKIMLPFVVSQFDMHGFGDYSVSPLVLAGAALFGLLTVWVSFRSPGRTAAGVSPVEAVHYTGESQNRSRKKWNKRQKKNRKKYYVRTGRQPSKQTAAGIRPPRLKDASLLLALRSLCREGKKAVLVILSLFLSLTLMNTTYTILQGFDLDRYASSQTNGDFEVTDWTVNMPGLAEKNLEGIDREFEEAVSRIPGLTRFDKVYCEAGLVDLSDDVMERLAQEEEQRNSLPYWPLQTGQDDVYAYTATGSLITEHAEYISGTFDAQKWAEGSYVIYNDIQHSPLYQPGDKLILEGRDGRKKEYTVMAVGGLPYTLTSRTYTNLGVHVILPEKEFAELYGEKQPLCVVYDVEKAHRQEAEKITAELAENSDKVYISFETLKAEFEQSKRAFSLIGGILSLILGAIGILNFTNIAVTGLLTRQKELAMLCAIGMGGRQMKKMLVLESMAYILSAALLTATAGSHLCRMICQTPDIQNRWAFVYHFTVIPVVLCLPVLLMITSLVPLLFYRKASRQSVVERLRCM